MRNEAAEGEVSPDTLRSAQLFIMMLQSRLAARPLPDPHDQQEASRFLEASSNLLGLLKRPDLRPALRELDKLQETSAGRLLGFMHAFNLRFGPATTPEEKLVYHRLFAMLDGARDRVLTEARLDSKAPARADPRLVIELLQKFGQGRPQGGASRPARPESPR